MSPGSLEWAGTVVRFLVNTEGCGYPPFVNCTEFALKYGHVDSGDITLFETINQPETRELYRHGNVTTEPLLMLESGITEVDNDVLQVSTMTAAISAERRQRRETAAAYKIFPCYYSRAYPDRVVADYDWYHTIKTLVAAVAIPWTLFVVSCTVLCYWYCPALKREFMIDKRKTAAMKNENPQLVIR